jgi:Holliday junction resolvasome RuvABC ATP-dependent DNA helicase subunit
MPTISQTEANAVIDQIFGKVRGQIVAKQKLKNKILSARIDGFIKPTLIVSSPGKGKTRLLKAFKEACRAVLGRKTLSFNDGSECGTKTLFVEEVLVPHFNDKEGILAIDEVHNCNAKIPAILRMMLDPDADRKVVEFTPAADHTIIYNPTKQSIFIATNKIDKIDTALLSRFDRIDLADYTDAEVMEIFGDAMQEQSAGANPLPAITFNENTLRKIAECNRGTARDVMHWVDAIREYLNIAGKTSINRADVKEIIRLRQTYPLGVSENELKTLLHLEANGPLQLKELAGLMIIDAKEQNANEKYLLQRRLISIEGKRHLSGDGALYLEELRKEGYIPRRAHKSEKV